MWNGLIRNIFLFFFGINIKLYISETPCITCYVTIKLLAKDFLGSHLKCHLSQLLLQLKQRNVGPYMLFKCLWMIFSGCLQPNIFSVKNTSVYFLSEPLSTWQFFLHRNINSGSPPSLDKRFSRPAARSTELPSDCVPGSGSPPVHTQPALKVIGGLGYVQWATEWKGERNMFLLLPNTTSLCILWIEAGSACAWAAVEGWRMWNW